MALSNMDYAREIDKYGHEAVNEDDPSVGDYFGSVTNYMDGSSNTSCKKKFACH